MNKKKRVVSLVIILFTSMALLFGRKTNSTTANGFLKMDIGARSLAMGGAFTAVADDINSIRYNPAGTRNLDKLEVQATHMEWIADLNVEQLSIGSMLPAYKRRYLDVISASLFYMGSETKIEGRDELGNITDPDLRYNSFVLTINGSRALDLYDNIFVGGNIKYSEENLVDNKYSSILLDGGVLYKYNKEINFGFAIRNIGRSDNGDKMPLEVRLGSSIQRDKLGLSLDLYKFYDTDVSFALGGEYFIKDILVLRAGYNYSISDNGKLVDYENWSEVSDYMVSGLSVGFGFLTKPIDFFRGYEFKLDYAMVNYGRLGFTHIFTLSTEF